MVLVYCYPEKIKPVIKRCKGRMHSVNISVLCLEKTVTVFSAPDGLSVASFLPTMQEDVKRATTTTYI